MVPIQHTSMLWHASEIQTGWSPRSEQVPIFSTLMASEGVVRNNLWQVGSQGFHVDRSYHIIQESNVYSEPTASPTCVPVHCLPTVLWLCFNVVDSF